MRGLLPRSPPWGIPPGEEGWTDEDPPGAAVLLTRVPMGPPAPAPRGTHPPAEQFPQQNQIWPEIFLNCSTDGQGSNDAGHHKTANSSSQNSGRGCMGSGTAGNGARGHASEFPRSTQSHTTHKQGPKRGSTAERTADADTKQRKQKHWTYTALAE